MAVQHFNVIYNRSDVTETEDSELALQFVEFLVKTIEGWGYLGYYADRDAVPGRSIFDETFRIVQETEKTIVVITPDFRTNYWAKYAKQAAFKYLIDQAHQHKLIPIAVNIQDNRTLKELDVNEPLYINGRTEAEWKNTRNSCKLDRLKKAFDPPTTQRVVEEIGDNRLRTEMNQQLVTRPASEMSMSSSSTDVRSNVTIPDSQLSLVFDDPSLPEPLLHSTLQQQNGLQYSSNQLTCLEYDGATSAADTENLNNQSVVEQKAPFKPEQNVETVGKVNLSSGSNMDDDGIDTASHRSGQNEEMSTDTQLVSLSDDTDLCVDVIQSINAGAPSSYLDPRPETLGAEGIHDAGPDIENLSVGSFEGDDNDKSDDTVPKQLQAPESGQSTCSHARTNQTDDAKVSELGVSGFQSGASPASKDSALSVISNPMESGTWNNIKHSILTVTKCVLHIDKAYPT